jgi:pectinesterase
MNQTYYVSKSISPKGDANVYPTVTEALSAVERDDRSGGHYALLNEDCADSGTASRSTAQQDGSRPVTIRIAPGIYREKVEIRRSNLTLIGEGTSPNDVVLSYDDFAFDRMPDETKRGTFRSYSVFIDASNVRVQNLTIENSSGDERTRGQAIALYAEGDLLSFEKVRLLGRQDTLFTGPLPPKEIQPGGFIGPKQFAPRINGRQYFKDCYICGNIDFIFGSATAVFHDCEIESLSHSDRPDDIQGYVCAPSTPEGQTYGYLFLGCRFVSKECAPGTCYLARPWREYAKAVFVNCAIGPHIHPDGFHDWNKPAFHTQGLFASYESHALGFVPKMQAISSGDLFEPQAGFAVKLTKAQADFYTNLREIFS